MKAQYNIRPTNTLSAKCIDYKYNIGYLKYRKQLTTELTRPILFVG